MPKLHYWPLLSSTYRKMSRFTTRQLFKATLTIYRILNASQTMFMLQRAHTVTYVEICELALNCYPSTPEYTAKPAEDCGLILC